MKKLILFIAKVRTRLVSIIRQRTELAYAIARWHMLTGKKVILFTKLHPIYADFAYSSSLKNFRYVYFHPAWLTLPLGKKLFDCASILHADAALLSAPMLDFKGKLFIECEAFARNEWLEDPRINRVIFQSHYASLKNESLKQPLIVYPAHSVSARRIQKKPLHQSQPIHLLTVGFGCFIKGYDVSFRIFMALKQKGYNVKLTIAGKSEHNFSLYPEASWEAFEAGKYGQIEDYGILFDDLEIRPFSRDELMRYVLPQSDILLHFSRMETFGYTILEALSFGIPVVSVRMKAIPEMITHGKNGLLCDPFLWDGTHPLDETRMNDPAWADICVERGLQYVEALINDPALYAQTVDEAFKSFSHFTFGKRAAQLGKLYQ